MTQRSRDRRDMRRAAPTKPGSARSQGGARTVATVRELLRSSPFGVGQIDFSVVIPAHNRPRQLIECLAAISVLAYPVSRYEVIVVDDGSDESMEPAVAPFLGRMNIALLRQSNSGPAKARNAGAAAARGKYVAFTDDDCRPDPCWLAALAKSVAANPGCAVGGQTINGLPENLFSAASQLLVQYVYRHWNRDKDDACFIASNNLAFPRECFIEIKGFDTRFPLAAAEDRELCDRWRWRDGRIVYAPDAIIHHFHALNLKTFLAQHFNYGRGAQIFREIRRQRAGKSVPFDEVSFYWNMPGYLFSHDRGVRSVGVAVLIGLSQIVLPLGYLRQWCLRSQKLARQQALIDHGDGARIPPVAPEE
jgi:glycosyltransferase involved in cell wall biosynthesis